MSSLSVVPSLATAKKAGLMTAGVTTAGYKEASAQQAAGAQASLTTANAKTGTAQNAQGAQAQAYTSDGVTANAKTRDHDSRELTSTNLDRILGEDSPLLQRARAIAREQANARGLMNTSMGVQAGTTAMIDTATPIAQSDASSYTNVLDRNLANEQQTEIFNAGQEQQNNQFNADQLGTTSRYNAGLEQDNNQYNTTQNNQMTMFNVGQENDISKFNAGQSNDVSMYNANLQQDNNQFNAQQANNISQFNANAFNNNQQFNANAQNQNAQFNANAFNQNAQFNTQQENQISVVNAAEQNKILQTMMTTENQIRLANIEAEYKVTMQSQATAGQLYQQTMKDITDILVNPELTQQSKQTAIDQKYTMLENGLQFTQDVAGLDIDLSFDRQNFSATRSGTVDITGDKFADIRTLTNYTGLNNENDRSILLNSPDGYVEGLLTTINQGHVTNARSMLETYSQWLADNGQQPFTEDGINKIMGAV